ncbi:MAG: RNA-binding protein [Francisellaceae bacterium]|jgi:RNA-binding protein
MTLEVKQRKNLKARAHILKPVVRIGEKGLTENVMAEIVIALEQHELIKIKIAGSDKDERKEISEEICQTLACDIVQSVGSVLVLYRKSIKQKKLK